jgi:hypothetical protein
LPGVALSLITSGKKKQRNQTKDKKKQRADLPFVCVGPEKIQYYTDDVYKTMSKKRV